MFVIGFIIVNVLVGFVFVKVNFLGKKILFGFLFVLFIILVEIVLIL